MICEQLFVEKSSFTSLVIFKELSVLCPLCLDDRLRNKILGDISHGILWLSLLFTNNTL